MRLAAAFALAALVAAAAARAQDGGACRTLAGAINERLREVASVECTLAPAPGGRQLTLVADRPVLAEPLGRKVLLTVAGVVVGRQLRAGRLPVLTAVAVTDRRMLEEGRGFSLDPWLLAEVARELDSGAIGADEAYRRIAEGPERAPVAGAAPPRDDGDGETGTGGGAGD